MKSGSSAGRIAAPAGYLDRTFTMAEVIGIVGLNGMTLTTWLSLAKLIRPIGDKVGHLRMYSAHEIYILGILAALHHVGVSNNGHTISVAIDASHACGSPRIPGEDEKIRIRQTPVAGIEVDLSAIWSDIFKKTSALLQPA